MDLAEVAIRQTPRHITTLTHGSRGHGAELRLREVILPEFRPFHKCPGSIWQHGEDVMKRIGAPLIGGVLTSFLMELVVYPAIYEVWKWNFEIKPRLRAQS